jgi:DNA invertase Pin-like site-specific DNA recombinase
LRQVVWVYRFASAATHPHGDTATPTGKLILNLLGSIAQFERELTLERQREGIAKAKADGKYKGRPPMARAKTDKVRELRDAGVRPAEIARQVGISRTSVYRVLGRPSTMKCSKAGMTLHRGLIYPPANFHG